MTKKIGVGTAVILIIASALWITAWYTSSSLEMAWILVWLIIPIVGLLLGGLLSLLVKATFGVSWQVVVKLAVFAVLLFSALMAEESSIGIIRSKFDNYTKTMNVLEREKSLHKVNLGEGAFLSFTNSQDDEFGINFTYEGENAINQDQIIQLARKWLKSKGYDPGDKIEFYLYPTTYRKGISFNLESQDNVGVLINVAKDPKHAEQTNIILNLSLRYKQKSLTFEEIGRSYQVLNPFP